MASCRFATAAPMSPAAEAYAAFCLTHTAQAQARLRHVLDIPFGADYWQKLDLYLPDDPRTAGVPTLLFMHGGYWTHGYKEWLGFMAQRSCRCQPCSSPWGIVCLQQQTSGRAGRLSHGVDMGLSSCRRVRR